MTEEHTPGPWRSGIPGNFTVYGPDGRGALSGPVADALPTKTINMRRANANLMSAAPDLFEALIQAVKIIREHVPTEALGSDMSGDLSEPHLTYSWPILEEHLHYMDAAINKAKGVNK